MRIARTALVEARLKRHWSQEEAAEAIGIDHNTLYRWEAGKATPRGYNLRQLCEVYGMTATELGFEQDKLAYRDSNQVAESGLIEETRNRIPGLFLDESIFAPLTEMSRPNTSGVSPYRVSMALLALGLQQDGRTFEELQFRTEQELRKLDTMTRQQGKKNSRREVLTFLSRLPAAIFGMTQIGSEDVLSPEELLPLYITGIPACWRLYFSSEVAEVGRIVPFYISYLTPFTQQPSRYQKMAASLLSQAHQLMAELVLQTEDFGMSLAYCKQALWYAQFADDPNVQAASLIRQSNTLFYRGRSTFQNNQQAVQYVEKISPLLRARIYAEYACDLALLKREQEARRYMGLAQETFPERPEDDPGFSYTQTNHYILYLNKMLFHLKFSEANEAWEAITKAGTFVSAAISPRRMEFLKHLVLSAIALDDLERSLYHFTELVAGASALGSDLWFNDLTSTHQQMLVAWPHEQRVKALIDHFQRER